MPLPPFCTLSLALLYSPAIKNYPKMNIFINSLPTFRINLALFLLEKYFQSGFLFQLNSDQFLNVDLLLEESMHALIIGPLTPRLRESLQHYYASTRTDTLNSTNSNTSEINKLNTRDKKAFEDCMKQVNESLSPLDKLAHLLTGFKVVSNAVCIWMYSTPYVLL